MSNIVIFPQIRYVLVSNWLDNQLYRVYHILTYANGMDCFVKKKLHQLIESMKLCVEWRHQADRSVS